MLDSIRWLLPSAVEPTIQDVCISLIILAVGWLLQQFIIKVFIKRLVAFFDKRNKPFEARVLEQFSRSIRFAFLTFVIFLSVSYLFEVWLVVHPSTKNLFWSLMLFFIFKGVADVFTYYIDNPKSFDLLSKNQDHNLLAPFFLRIGKVLVMIFALFTIASLWDFNLNGFLTGIGLTGVAIAFGIRDTLGHVFGGMAVALDNPFQIGDWVATEDNKIEGIIEDINLRSTLIQTGDKGLVYVPNAYFVNRPIYNLTKREKRKCEHYVYVSTNNDEQTLRDACDNVREQIYLHAKTEKDIIFVYIDDFRPTAYRILIRFFVTTNDSGEMMAVRQDILFALKHIFEKAQIEYAQDDSWVHQEIVK
ncbi:mechanosensitive ion channel family protein [Solibacillus sp. CAU 1738]|uniref:mechanosensitive ion channel family protein n=1 Tax=Solibacillus sp. CAU 1738 TaxID=3140363 RepID=UPI0032602A1F